MDSFCRITTGIALGLCILGGILIAVAHNLAEGTSEGVGWAINALGWIVLAGVIIPACNLVKGGGVQMKYVMAVLACLALVFLYALLGATVFGWRRGGGFVPMIILFALIGATWRLITKSGDSENNQEEKKQTDKKKTPKEPPPKPAPFMGFQDIPVSKGTDAGKQQQLTDGGSN